MTTSDVPHSPLIPALHRHAIELLSAALYWAGEAEWIRADVRDGLGVRAEEVAALLRFIEPDIPSTARRMRSSAEAWSALWDELVKWADAGDPLALRWRGLVVRTGLTAAEAQLLAVLVSVASEHGLNRAYRYAWADFGRLSMPLGFALRVLAGDGAIGSPATRELANLFLPEDTALYAHGLVTRHREQADTPLTEVGLLAHDEAVSILLGQELLPAEFALGGSLEPPPERLLRAAKRLADWFKDNPNKRRWGTIYGPPGAGRKAMAAVVSEALTEQGSIYELDLGRFVEAGGGVAHARRAIRFATLLDATLVVTGLNRLPAEIQRRWAESVEHAVASTQLPLIWLLDEEPPVYLDLAPETKIPVAYPSRVERTAVWRGLLDDNLKDDAEKFAGRFLITEGQISRTIREARVRAVDGGHAELIKELEAVARREAAVGLGKLASPETKKVYLSQLVVDDETRTLLDEIISYTAHREQLATEWGFERMLPYGLGVTALFAGPPGTGKTLAANAIATALGLELYRVDLSQLVSKFIGETEKHLATLFTAAENGEVMLLFDEADSLFSKRTEVKSSTDRYANLEVNYLLQRIERFDGVVTLTTNFEAGIDDAFARRIRFRVGFPDPDASARRLLWRALTPSDVPLAKDVNFDALAEDYELSGGHIKEVVLRAAALAWGQAGESVVSQELLIRSAEAEYRKLGKLVVTYDDFKP